MEKNFTEDGCFPDVQSGVVLDRSGRVNEGHSVHTPALWLELAIAMGPDGPKTLLDSFRAINAAFSAPDFPERLSAAKESLQG